MITVQINENSAAAIALLEFLKTLDFVSFSTPLSNEKKESKIKWVNKDLTTEAERAEIEKRLNKKEVKLYDADEVFRTLDKEFEKDEDEN